MTAFEFATATRVVFGSGALKQAGSIAASFGAAPLVVTGRQRRRAEPLLEDLRSKGLACETFAVSGEPTLDLVREGVALARESNRDMVLALGGGSVIDAGKAIAALAANPGDPAEYLEVIGKGRPLSNVPLAFLAIPTTAGTGAEVTRNAVLCSPEHRVKVSLRSPLMLAKAAVVDPDLTHDLPPDLTAATGLDALTQLIEPLVSCRANPLTDAICRDGIRRAAGALRRAFVDGRDRAAREDMSLASLMGGLALANAGLGAVHGLAAPLGGLFPAPHGAVCAALLPHVMAANVWALRTRAPDSPVLNRFDEIGAMLTGTRGAKADDGVAWVRGLCRDLGIPGLKTYGLTPAAIPEVVDKALVASSMKANPIALTAEELSTVLERALGG